MHHPVDERRLRELCEQSDDPHSDVMRANRESLEALVDVTAGGRPDEARRMAAATITPEHPDERGRWRNGTRTGRRHLLRSAVVGGLAGGGLLTAARSAWAAADDVATLQTAASIENLAVSAYRTALTLPFIGGSSANPVIRGFAQRTMAQHVQHAQAFNAAATKLGGKAQTGTDPKYAPVVAAAVPTIKGPGDVVSLAITLETVAAETYVKDTSLVTAPALRQLFASVAGVEAQHQAVLLTVQALLNANDAEMIAAPPPVAQLPKTTGSVGFPNAFYPTSMASPTTEGAVR
ncbi:MAG: ferritin-like domain-containing protein [Frankia sp.]